jgi:hypothetical protein
VPLLAELHEIRNTLAAAADTFNIGIGYYAKMEATAIIKSMMDFYWDIRPKPEYGTIELRVCDTPLTAERAVARAGCCRRCGATGWNGARRRRSRTTIWSTTTSVFMPAVSGWTAPSPLRRPRGAHRIRKK